MKSKTGSLNTPEKYAKNKKRKKVAWIVFFVGFIGVGSLSILSFLGRYSGNFSIQLVDIEKNVLTLSDSPSFSSPTTYLKASGLENAYVNNADALPSEHSVLDALDGNVTNGTKTNALDGNKLYDTYMNYAFFLKNTTNRDIEFMVSLNIDDVVRTEGAVSLIDILRIRLYTNIVTADPSEATHDFETYAMASTSYSLNDDGSKDWREPISQFNMTDGKKDPSVCRQEANKGFATEFISDNAAFQKISGLKPNEVVRYSIVMWLEGYDADCKGQEPSNSSMTLSMTFMAQ